MNALNQYSFKFFFKDIKTRCRCLPVCHTTDGFHAREILKQGKITVKEDGNYEGEKLTYLFYGRPAYRTGQISDSVSLNSFWPVCFLLDIRKIEPKRIYPFDTGAAYNNIYMEHLRKEMKMEVFEMDKSIKEIPKFIQFFYNDNRNYFFGQPLPDLSEQIPKTFFELESYYELIKRKGRGDDDNRNSSIEIQYDKDILFTKDSIKLVVAPNVYFDDAAFKESLTKYAKNVSGYPVSRGNPNEYHMIVYNKILDYLVTRKIL